MIIYNEIVRDCFFMPRHVGTLDVLQPFTVHSRSNLSDLDKIIIDLYLQCTEQTFIKKACFKAKGPPFLIASMEYWCRLVENKTLGELNEIKYQSLVKELDLPLEQYPIALKVEGLGKAVLMLMKNKF